MFQVSELNSRNCRRCTAFRNHSGILVGCVFAAAYTCATGMTVHFRTTWNAVLVGRSSARMLVHLGEEAPAQYQCVRSTTRTRFVALSSHVVFEVAYTCATGMTVQFRKTWNAYQVVLVFTLNARRLVHIDDKAPARFERVRCPGRTLVFARSAQDQIGQDIASILYGVTRTCRNS